MSRDFSGPCVANGLPLEVGTIVTPSFKKVAGSIPDNVIGIFHSHNPSVRSMALGLTQTPIEMCKGKGKSVPLQARGAQRVPGS